MLQKYTFSNIFYAIRLIWRLILSTYIENDDFLPELELIGFSTLVSANKANLKDSSINIYTGIANVILLVSGTWKNSGVFYIGNRGFLGGDIRIFFCD